MRINQGFLEFFVHPGAREDPRRRLRYLGIAKSLLTISSVVGVLFLCYLLVRPDLLLREALLFLAGILSPLLGALFVRSTGRIELGLFLTNMAGIGIVAVWCLITGGIHSVALPWFLPNLFLLSTFGSKRMLLVTAGSLVAVLILVFLASRWEWIPPNPVPPALIPVFNLMSMMSSVAVVVIGAIVVTGERENTKRHLQHAKEAAESASRAKSAFLTSMSHELRTPLNAVMISAELLKEDPDRPLEPRQAQLVDQIFHGGDLLLGFVNQVLELSRIETGDVSLRIEEVPLKASFAASLSVVESFAIRREVSVECETEEFSELWVLADPLALKSVLVNLLSNAVKYNHHHGQVFVTAQETGAGKVRISIRDTGPGIPGPMHQAAFQPFNRLQAEGSHIEGTGLGLSIAERLVHMMAGSMGLQSAEGEGSTFWIELPAAPPSDGPRDGSATTGQAVASFAVPAPPLEILVAEDHPVNQDLLRYMLEKWGHRATIVPDGRKALEAVIAQGEAGPKFDVILMDVLMPEMDGLEATRRIRMREAGTDHHIPIVAVTACASAEDREACFEAGMDYFVAKPFKSQEVVALLQNLQPAQNLGKIQSSPEG
jgi:signal transduction histidine kinase